MYKNNQKTKNIIKNSITYSDLYKNINKNNDLHIKKSLSSIDIINDFIITEETKLKNSKSFVIQECDQLFSLNDSSSSLNNNTQASCLTCHNLYNKRTNNYCSFQCYKKSKKDIYGIFHLKCPICNKFFTTKSIFTDYCSNECFLLDTSDKFNIFLKNL
jgi:endogenous inhibitor of DNA gyrase (YacG/DUF329 family)